MNKNFFKRTLLGKTICCSIGLFMYALGVYCTLQANIGLGPWEALAMGVSGKTGLIYGNATLIVSFVVLTMDVLMRERIGIGTVHHASISDALTACRGATEAMHADLKKELCRSGVKIKNLADDTFLRNSHSENLLFIADFIITLFGTFVNG